jgi:hypothetical protein
MLAKLVNSPAHYTKGTFINIFIKIAKFSLEIQPFHPSSEPFFNFPSLVLFRYRLIKKFSHICRLELLCLFAKIIIFSHSLNNQLILITYSCMAIRKTNFSIKQFSVHRV